MRHIPRIITLALFLFALSTFGRAATVFAASLEDMYDSALELIHTGKYEQAYTLLKQVNEQKPGYKDVYYNLGLCAEKLGYTTESYKYFQLGIEQLKEASLNQGELSEFQGFNFIESPEQEHIDPAALLRLAKVYLEQGEYEFAEQYAKKYIALNPETAEGYLVLGKSQFYQNQDDTALKSLKKAIYYQPKLSEAFYFAAKIRERNNMFNYAEANYRLAIKFDTSNIDVYLDLAKLYGRLNQDTRAIEILSQAHRRFPNNIDVLISLGRLKLKTGDYCSGFDLLQQARKNLGNELLIDDIILNYAGPIAACLEKKGKLEMSLYYYQVAYKKTKQEDYLLKAAQLYLRLDKAQDALNLLAPIAETTQNPLTYKILGQIYSRLHKPAQAILAYETYLGKRRDPQIQLALAQLYKKEGLLDKYESLLKELLNQPQYKKHALSLLADYYYEQRDFGLARKYYAQLLRYGVKSDTIFWRIANSEFEIGNTDACLKYLYKAIERAQRPDYYFLQFKAFYKKGDYIAAEKSLKNVLALEPQYFPALYNMGLILYKLKNYQRALDFFLKAQRFGNLPELQEYIGLSYFALGKYEKALPFLEQNDTRTYRDKIFVSYFNIAKKRFLAKHYFGDTGAVALYKKALTYLTDNTNRAKIYFQLGLIYAYSELEDSAYNYFQLSFKEDPKFYAPFFNIGVLYEGKGMYDSAIIFYKKVLQYEPASLRAITNIANCYAKKGLYPDAAKWYERAYAVAPHNQAVIENLIKTYILLNKLQAAENLLPKLKSKPLQQVFQIQIMYRRGDKARALQKIETLLSNETAPLSEKAVFEIFVLLLDVGRTDKAVAFIKKYMSHRYDPALFSQTLKELLKSNNYDSAVYLVNSLAQNHNKRADFWLKTAIIFYDNGYLDDAEKYALSAQKLNDNEEVRHILHILQKVKAGQKQDKK